MHKSLAILILTILTSPPMRTALTSAEAALALIQNESGVMPLMSAVRRQDLKSARDLLHRGADPNEVSAITPNFFAPRWADKSETPLMAAVRNGDEAMARLLVSAGARARWRDGRGRTMTELAAALQRSRSLVALLFEAERREFTLTPDWSLPETVALMALGNIARNYGTPAARARLNSSQLRRIHNSAETLWRRWPSPPPPRPPSLGASLTRDVNALEWAIERADNELLKTVADDLETKLQDCLSSPERAFGEVKISIRTFLSDGSERPGLRIRYIERFFWDLLSKAPSIVSQWKEFAAATAVLEEPVPAGDYVLIARSADGRDLSEAKPISVSRNRSTRFDLVLR